MPANDIGSFLSAFMGPVNQKLEESHQREQLLKDEQRKIQQQTYQDVLSHPERYDPQIYPDLAKQAGDSLAKLLNPGARKMHGKIGGLIQKLQGVLPGILGQQRQQAEMTAPNFAQDVSKFATAQVRDPVQARREREWQDVKNAKTPEERQDAIDKAVFFETGRYTPPKSAQANAKKLVTFTKPDGTDVPTMWDPKSGLFYKRDKENEVVQVEDDWQQKAGPANVRPVTVPVTLTRANALDELDRGLELLDVKGDPLDPETISKDPNVILQGFIQNGQLRYAESHVNSKTLRLGNWLIPITPSQMDVNAPRGLPAPFPVPIAAGTTRQTEHRGIDPNTGQPVAETLQTTSTPNTAQIPQNPAAAQALPAPQLQGPRPAAGQPGAPQPGGAGPQTRGGTRKAPQGGHVRPMSSMPPGMSQQQENQAASITGVVGTLFGDPEFPDFKSLADYSYLADKPDSRQRIATAVDVIRNISSEGSPDLATLRVGPVHVGFGAAGDWVNYFLGLPRAASSEKVKSVQSMMQDLAKHPDEAEAFNAFMTAYSDIIALRSLTRGSPAQSNVRAIQTEMANMMTASSQKMFNNALSRTAQLIQKGSQYNQFIKPGLKKRMEEFLGGKGGATPAAEKNLSSPKDKGIQKKLDEIF